MSIRDFFKRAAIGVFNRLSSDEDRRNDLICYSTIIGISLGGFLSIFPLAWVTDNPFIAIGGSLALTFGPTRPAIRWMKWACDQPMPKR